MFFDFIMGLGTVFKDYQQITSVMLNRFCLLSKNPSTPPPPSPPVLNGQCQANQNEVENTCPFSIVFQVLKVLLIKIYKTQPPALSFLLVLN